MRSFLEETDQWLRSRIRMCIWKCWKRVRTRFKNLQEYGIAKWQAWQWANTRKGYWRENSKGDNIWDIVIFLIAVLVMAGL